MGRAEAVILIAVVVVAAGAVALESFGPDVARTVAISACLLLILAMAVGLVVRVRMKRRRRTPRPPATRGGDVTP